MSHPPPQVTEETTYGEALAIDAANLADDATEAVAEGVEERPWTSAMAALGLGFLFGALWRV